MALTVEAAPPRRGRGPMTEDQRAALAVRAKESERRFAAALARTRNIPPDEMSEDGCINLVRAFWDGVRDDLAHGSPGAFKWLDTDGFLRWAAVGGQDPDDLRRTMQERVWRNPEYCTCAVNRGVR